MSQDIPCCSQCGKPLEEWLPGVVCCACPDKDDYYLCAPCFNTKPASSKKE